MKKTQRRVHFYLWMALLPALLLVVAINAVWISALLHGVTAVPGANWYARKVGSGGKPTPAEALE